MPRFDVTIAGELNLDLILYGLPEELPPERELLADDLRLTLGGSSAIVAHNLAALGAKVGFISCIGDDPLGRIALERLREAGVDVSQVRIRSGATTGVTVILHHPLWRNILTYAGTIFDLRFHDLDFSYLTDSRHFHLSSFYLQRGLRGQIPEMLRRVKSAGLTVSVDPNDDPDDQWDIGLKEALRYVDVFLPNAREACKITASDDVDVAIARMAELVPCVAVKLGPQGSIVQRGPERFTAHGLPVEVVDAVGAGDSFDAGFLSQYIRGADLPTCLEYGNRAGAFSVSRAGGTEAFRDRAYLDEFFRVLSK
jgi:sugar/nucleoside kinase (ribokinase family)